MFHGPIWRIVCLVILLQACSPRQRPLPHDPHSFSNADEISISHIDLDLDVDFQQRRLRGYARLHVDNFGGADSLVLDTRELHIIGILLDDTIPADYSLRPEIKDFGQALLVRVMPNTRTVLIRYETSPTAAALQWLSPAQTAGKKHPFLFTQSQAILARSWIPCHDRPAVRFTYSARISCPPTLMAVMGAKNTTSKHAEGQYQFEMRQSIPSYLMALAVGDIEFRPLGRRTGIYAEPLMIDKAVWEFGDAERMLESAERLLGPYRWERFDILVLPPSFPFGGMENPRLTFATPTVIAGDKSLVALIAHELAHSWSGNLVTNARWHDVWLNEGLTTYFERRVVEDIYGKEYKEMEALLSRKILADQVAESGTADKLTALYQDLDSLRPDDSGDIIYEKGYFFLRLIEETIGRDRTDMFFRKYFDEFAFKQISTEEFLDYFDQQVIQGDRRLAEKLDIRGWVYGTGVPATCPVPVSEAFTRVDTVQYEWTHGMAAKALRTHGWNSQQWVHFITHLPPNLSHRQMRDLDEAFRFSHSGNAEIRFAWLEHVIANEYQPGYTSLEQFLTDVGRRKFVKPLYEAMAKRPNLRLLAEQIYAKARPGYHPITYQSVDEVLGTIRQ